MVIKIVKGSSYSGKLTSPDMGIVSDWSGSLGLYESLEVAALHTFELTLIGGELVYNIPLSTVESLGVGEYTMLATITSISLSYLAQQTFPVIVTPNQLELDTTLIYCTISKVDGTPAGRQTKTIVNSTSGATMVSDWEGVTVTASHAGAGEVTGIIVGTESISTKTDARGYAQLTVIKGQTVTVTCPSFRKSVTVDTTGLDTIDLSSYF